MSQYDDTSLEFYGWECISLKLATRTIDFVITDPLDRLKFVIGIEAAIQSKVHILNNPSRLLQIKAQSKII